MSKRKPAERKKGGKRKTVPIPEPKRTKAQEEWDRRVLAAFLYMTMRKPTKEQVAAAVGVTPRTIYNWRIDPELWEAARKAARTRWMGEAEDAARSAVINSLHAGNANLGMEMLSRVDRELAPRSKHEISGPDGGPVETKTIPVDDMSDADLARMAVKLAQELAK